MVDPSLNRNSNEKQSCGYHFPVHYPLGCKRLRVHDLGTRRSIDVLTFLGGYWESGDWAFKWKEDGLSMLNQEDGVEGAGGPITSIDVPMVGTCN